MKLADFDYDLPRELIAQYPCKKRDGSRLLLLHRQTGMVEHLIFKDLPDILGRDDVLVLNDTRVFKARLIGRREGFTGRIEILITRRLRDNIYNVLARPSKRLTAGTRIIFDDKRLSAEVVGRVHDYIQLCFNVNGGLHDLLDEIGSVPLPPYIKRDAEELDESRYQTIYAKNKGAIAAPTAGLHFTEGIISRVKSKGINIAFLTLHVGYGTFKPVTKEDITRHSMHKEYYEIADETAKAVNNAKAGGKKVIAAGTTVCRALETAVFNRNSQYAIRNTRGHTGIFIYPGYDFKIIDGLLTNFHLPRTTLFMLVSAFAGRENIMKAYQDAIRQRYRFFSYGDAMLIV
jgi:S-adenosylmethionine:tRNA ribosyltransferase-isomerase